MESTEAVKKNKMSDIYRPIFFGKPANRLANIYRTLNHRQSHQSMSWHINQCRGAVRGMSPHCKCTNTPEPQSQPHHAEVSRTLVSHSPLIQWEGNHPQRNPRRPHVRILCAILLCAIPRNNNSARIILTPTTPPSEDLTQRAK